MNKTLDFYNLNYDEYFNSTVNGNMNKQYDDFLDGIPKKGLIMDLGCGSGRDSKYFLKNGYRVVSIDGSKSLAKKASEYLSQEVLVMDFNDVLYKNKFDGIWACASLLHIPKDEFIFVMNNLLFSLKRKGKMYISLKEGIGESYEGDRFYQYYSDDEIRKIISNIGGLKLTKSYSSQSVTNPNENRRWNNYFFIKE